MIALEHTLQIILAVVPVVASAVIGWIFHKIKLREEKRDADELERKKKILAREKATDDALRALCRDRILQGYHFYKRQVGVSTADLETMTKLYNAYHGLGGNGTITAVYDKICALPLKEEQS